MARHRHATALFEVANRSSRPTQENPRSGGLLGFFFPRRRSALAAGGLSAAPSSPGVPTITLPPTTPSMADLAPAPAMKMELPVAPPAPVPVARLAPARSAPDVGERSEGITLAIDSARREVCLRLSYLSTAIAGAALVVVLGFAYFLGRQVGSAPRPVLAEKSTPTIRASQPNPRVMTVATSNNNTGGGESVAPRPVPGAGDNGAPPRPSDPPQTLVVDDSRRQADLNYVVVQSYPNEQMAADARDLLKKNGISSTVERGLKGWGASWYCVVGTKGFAKISSPEFKAYLAQIKQISDQNMTVRSFKAFQPQAYKWGGER